MSSQKTESHVLSAMSGVVTGIVTFIVGTGLVVCAPAAAFGGSVLFGAALVIIGAGATAIAMGIGETGKEFKLATFLAATAVTVGTLSTSYKDTCPAPQQSKTSMQEPSVLTQQFAGVSKNTAQKYTDGNFVFAKSALKAQA